MVFARTPAGGLGLFVVPEGSGREFTTPLTAVDRTRPLSRVTLTPSPARLGGEQDGERILPGMRDLACTALAAEQVGAPPALATAKSACSEAYSAVAGEMIQLHGGIGITWEHPAHDYFKRAHGSAQLFGSLAAHREQLAAELGFNGPRSMDSPIT